MDICTNIQELTKLIHEVIDEECGLRPPKFSDYSQFDFTKCCQMIKAKIYSLLKEKEQLTEDDAFDKLVAEIINLRINDLKMALADKCSIYGYSRLNNFDWNIKLSMSSSKLAATETLLMNLILETTKYNSIDSISLTAVTNKNLISNCCDIIKTSSLDTLTKNESSSDTVTKETVSMELNQEELKYLIASLESADKEIHQLMQNGS